MKLRWAWLGRVDFADAVACMEALRLRILGGEAAETLLMLEHPPTITLGRRARAEHVHASAAELQARGITVACTTRGGDVTYHGPGQLVAYPIMRLDDGVVAHVERLARAAIDVAGSFALPARFDRARPGVWVDPDVAAGRREGGKLAAVGVHVHRRVAIHGLALNVSTALDAFDLITPCGMCDVRVTSLAALAGVSPRLETIAEHFAEAFGRASLRSLARLEVESAARWCNLPLLLDRPSVE